MSRAQQLTVAITLSVLAALLLPSVASADQQHYDGVHPINAEDGMCYIEAPHIHIYAPLKPSVLFHTEGGHHHFIGDPAAYGWDGPRYSFHGHHPLVGVTGDVYCYIDGAHFHHWAPEISADFEVKGDVYWYIGAAKPTYKKNLYRRKRVNAVYADIRYERPVITVEPPAAYLDVLVVAPSAAIVVEPAIVHTEVHAPIISAEVGLIVPTVSLEIGAHGHRHDHGHGVIIRDSHKHKKHKHKKYKHKHKKYKHKHKKRRWKF